MRYLVLILVLSSMLVARASSESLILESPSPRLLTEVTDEPAWFWMIWWTGAGNVSDFLVSNTIQGGAFARHQNDEHPYQGELALASIDQYDDIRGNNAEFPAGSEQFYLYCSGLWFGAKYPAEIDGPDTTWKASVSKGAYKSDMGAMSVSEMEDGGSMGDISMLGLYFSDMLIPTDSGYAGEGDYLFVQPGELPRSYQVRWPFADTMLNKRRPPDEQLDPSKGDMVFPQNTFAVGGDWIPEDSATTVWILYPYDGHGLGIRVEQRTYSWDHTALANCIVLNYKIRNMNDFTLKEPYFSYFADPDIGEGGEEPGDQGFWDDCIGFDRDRKLGYAYDYDGNEPGWETPAGHIGAVLLDTPEDVGLTGFEMWLNGNDIDEEGQDSLKYSYMTAHQFVQWERGNDVRMLLNSGPYSDMASGEEYHFTLAVVLGEDLEELQNNVDSVRAAFEEGFVYRSAVKEKPPVSPPGPGLKLTTSNLSEHHIGISYSLPSPCDLDISVFDAAGRRVESLYDGHASAGYHQLTWDASVYPRGVYFLRLTVSDQHLTQRVVVIK